MANVVGQRVRRREDPRFLTGRGQLRRRPSAAGRAPRPVRALLRGPRPDRRDRQLQAALAAARHAGVHRRRHRSDGTAPPPFIPVDPQLMFRPFIASEKVRFVGDIVAVVLSETRDGGLRCRRARGGRVRAAARRDRRRETPCATRSLLFDSFGTNTCIHVPRRNPTRTCSTAARSSISGTIESQRIAALPGRAACDGRAVRRRRPADGAGSRPRRRTPTRWCSGLVLGLEPESGPRDRARRRRRLRRQGARGRGRDPAAGWRARPRGPSRWTETRSENLVAMHQGRAQQDRLRARRQPRRGRRRRCGSRSSRTPARIPASARSSPTSRR